MQSVPGNIGPPTALQFQPDAKAPRASITNQCRVNIAPNLFDPAISQQQLNDWLDLEYRVITNAETIPNKLQYQLEAAENQSLKSKNENLFTDEPEVHTDDFVAYAQGQHNTMEDDYIIDSFEASIAGTKTTIKTTGVFDGHRGSEWVAYGKKHIIRHLKENIQSFTHSGQSDLNLYNALKTATVRLNLEDTPDRPKNSESGATALLALQINGDLWISNLGGSRALLVNVNEKTTRQISEDAKPDLTKYKASIEKRGGEVTLAQGCQRVNQRLAVARSLGDFHLNGAISARPKITKLAAYECKGKILVQVSDGITEALTSQKIGEIVHQTPGICNTRNKVLPTVIARKIVITAYQRGSSDNLTALVMPLANSIPDIQTLKLTESTDG